MNSGGDDMTETTVAIPPDVAGALAEAAAESAPPELFGAIEVASTARRVAHEPHRLGAGAAEPGDPFTTTARELHALLLDLSDEEWTAPTTTVYGAVRDVVAHLAGIEDYCTRALARRPAADASLDFDHPACSRDVAASLATLSNRELAD